MNPAAIMRTPRFWLGLIMCLPSIVVGQTKEVIFPCPDPDAKLACDSFNEIMRKHPDWISEPDDFNCFREKEDSFFTIDFGIHSQGSQLRSWSRLDENGRPRIGAVADGTAIAWTTDHGIEDDNQEPTFSFLHGRWTHYSEFDSFHADRTDPKRQDVEADRRCFEFGRQHVEFLQERPRKDHKLRLVHRPYNWTFQGELAYRRRVRRDSLRTMLANKRMACYIQIGIGTQTFDFKVGNRSIELQSRVENDLHSDFAAKSQSRMLVPPLACTLRT